MSAACATHDGPPTRAGRAELAGITLEGSPAWYAVEMLALFPDGIPVHGHKYSATDLPCVATDLASFDVQARTVDIGLGPAFAVEGSFALVDCNV